MDGIDHLSFIERLSGPLGMGVERPRLGAEHGRAARTRAVADLAIMLQHPDVNPGERDAHHGRVSGTIHVPDLATNATAAGNALLYVADPAVGMKQIRYDVRFQGDDGSRYRLEAVKFIRPGRCTWREHVTAYARVFRDSNEERAERERRDAEDSRSRAVAAGILTVSAWQVVALLRSVRVPGMSRTRASRRFLAFVRREAMTPTPVKAT